MLEAGRCAAIVRGPFSGRALLIFPEAQSLELVRSIVGAEHSLEDVIDLEQEALAETGNIILNACLATIANRPASHDADVASICDSGRRSKDVRHDRGDRR